MCFIIGNREGVRVVVVKLYYQDSLVFNCSCETVHMAPSTFSYVGFSLSSSLLDN